METPPGPGLLMSALAQATHSRVRRALGSSGGCSPWRWPRPCATVPAQWLQLPQRREERRPSWKDQQQPLPWPLGNSPGKMLGNVTWAKFPDKCVFFKKQIIHQAHSLFAETINKNSGLNFHRSVFVFMCMSMSVCVCPRV